MEASTKVIYAALYLEGDADIWFQTIQHEYSGLIWDQFVELLYHRFAKGGYENIIGQFNKLTQKGRVEEYIAQFDELRKYVATVDGKHHESYYVDSFLSGLKEEISSALYLNKPVSLRDAREMARRQESLIEIMDKRHKGHSRYTPLSGQSKPTSTTPTPPLKELPSKPLPTGVKKLSYGEMADRRSKGLCFNCDEKFSAGHVCKNKQVFMITTEEDSSPAEDSDGIQISWDVNDECNPWGTVDEGSNKSADVSLHAISGTQGLHTLQIKGTIKSRTVTLLVDTGSTHSFISQQLVKQLRLPVTPCEGFTVTVASGDKLHCNQLVQGVKWLMAGKIFTANFHVIPVGGYDLIL